MEDEDEGVNTPRKQQHVNSLTFDKRTTMNEINAMETNIDSFLEDHTTVNPPILSNVASSDHLMSNPQSQHYLRVQRAAEIDELRKSADFSVLRNAVSAKHLSPSPPPP